MEDNQNIVQETEPTPTPAPENDGESTYTPPATQADLNRIIEGRLKREREKYADYDHLKREAGKVAGLVAERDELKQQLETANGELGEYKTAEQKRKWAFEVSQETGVPADALRGDSKEEMEAHAATLEKYVKRNAPYVGSDGRTPAQPQQSNSAAFGEILKQLM